MIGKSVSIKEESIYYELIIDKYKKKKFGMSQLCRISKFKLLVLIKMLDRDIFLRDKEDLIGPKEGINEEIYASL